MNCLDAKICNPKEKAARVRSIMEEWSRPHKVRPIASPAQNLPEIEIALARAIEFDANLRNQLYILENGLDLNRV